MKLVISKTAWDKMQYITNKCDAEVGGLGFVEVRKDSYYVDTVFLIEQEVTGASVDIKKEDFGKLVNQHFRDTRAMKFQWHSHVNMGAFWSHTDKENIFDLGKDSFCVALVLNKKGEKKGGFYAAAGKFTPEIFVEEIPVEIQDSLTDEVKKAIDAEIELKVKRRVLQETKAFPPYTSQEEYWKRWEDYPSYYEGQAQQEREKAPTQKDLTKAWDRKMEDVKQQEFEFADIDKMTKEEKQHWFNMYTRNYGYNPTSETELEDFIDDWNMFIGGGKK